MTLLLLLLFLLLLLQIDLFPALAVERLKEKVCTITGATTKNSDLACLVHHRRSVVFVPRPCLFLRCALRGRL